MTLILPLGPLSGALFRLASAPSPIPTEPSYLSLVSDSSFENSAQLSPLLASLSRRSPPTSRLRLGIIHQVIPPRLPRFSRSHPLHLRSLLAVPFVLCSDGFRELLVSVRGCHFGASGGYCWHSLASGASFVAPRCRHCHAVGTCFDATSHRAAPPLSTPGSLHAHCKRQHDAQRARHSGFGRHSAARNRAVTLRCCYAYLGRLRTGCFERDPTTRARFLPLFAFGTTRS